jgi:tetrahydromethanopterin S-methyltransferase subunit A
LPCIVSTDYNRGINAPRPDPAWPPLPGSYSVGNPTSPAAVCVLTTSRLVDAIVGLDQAAIAGALQTANLGIETIVVNVIANPYLRFLVVCGRDSKLFRQGQSLLALIRNGVDDSNRILGAEGYEPQLSGVSAAAIDRFRRQVEPVDLIGVEDATAIAEALVEIQARSPGPLTDADRFRQPELKRLRPGGKREPLRYDPNGFFVISLDRDQGEIHLVHYRADRLPAHEMRGRTAEPMLLGLLRERLVGQLSHAGYLGAELAKAETALRLDLTYEQDRPLSRPGDPRS